MKADSYAKISKYVLYGSAAVILVVFFMFFCVGEPLVLEQTSEATNETTEIMYPQYTGLSLYLCYIMLFVALLLVLIFESVAMVKNMMYSTKGLTKKIVRVVLILAAVLVIYLVSPTDIDFLLYLQYTLLGVAMLLMIGSMFIAKIRS
mgnify:CR=1 FL=1